MAMIKTTVDRAKAVGINDTAEVLYSLEQLEKLSDMLLNEYEPESSLAIDMLVSAIRHTKRDIDEVLTSAE
jgi:hypothetical protein